MKNIFTLFLVLFIAFSGYACGNEYGHTIDGRKIYTRNLYFSNRMLSFDSIAIEGKIKDLYNRLGNNPGDYKNWSDLALNFLKVGRTDTALKILIPLVKKHPKEYNIIANLGTAYELNGQLDSALKYISAGYKQNPGSHRGSEWIHEKILQAKIKEKKQPGWLRINSIISQEELIGRLDSSNRHRRYPAGKVNNDIYYQLRTRSAFTPAPNRVMANILVSLGEFNTSHGIYETALMSYAYALKYEETNYGKRKINTKLRSLNKKRKDLSETMEVDGMFMKMMQRSEINPELVLMGLEDFAEKLDSIHLDEVNQIDSINLLKHQLDSLKTLKPAVIKEEKEESSNSNYFIGILSFIIGAIGALVGSFLFRKKGSK